MSRLSTFPWFSTVIIFLSVAGLILPPLALIAIGVGIIGFNRARSPSEKRLLQGAVALSCAGLLVTAVLLLLSKEQAADAATECQIGLKALNSAQDAHRKTRGRYASSPEELGLPVGQQYFLSTTGANESVLSRLHVGQFGQCPECTVTMACQEKPTGAWWTITSGGKPLRATLER